MAARSMYFQFFLVILLCANYLNDCHGFANNNVDNDNKSINRNPTNTDIDNDNFPPPPDRLTPDDRQAKMLEKMGYRWNGQKWVRGDADSYLRRKASARSSSRYITFVDQSSGQPAATPSAVQAAKRMSQVLLQARQKAVTSTKESLARDRDLKNWVQKKEAPYVWFSAEALLFGILTAYGKLDWGHEFQVLQRNTVNVLLLSTIIGLTVSYSRAFSRSLLPGVEESTGRLTRVLADVNSEQDTIALPAPSHVRYPNTGWRLAAFAGESLSAINIALLLHGVFQTRLVNTLTQLNSPSDLYSDGPTAVAIVLAVMLTALPASAVTVKSASPPWDGIPAEVEAMKRANSTIGAYFHMQTLPAEASADEASRCFSALATSWIAKYDGVSNGAEWKVPFLAFLGSLAYAVAFAGSSIFVEGGEPLIVIPIVARVVAAADTYLIRNEKDLCQIKVALVPKQGGRNEEER